MSVMIHRGARSCVIVTASELMYHGLTQILFWLYWAIVFAAGALVVREMFRTSSLTAQVTAGLALIPLILRALLIK